MSKKNELYRDIPEEELERLKKLAKSNKATVDSVVKKFELERKTLKESGIKVNLDRLAVNKVMNEFRRTKVRQAMPTKKKDVTIVYGFICGDRGVWDKAEQVRREVKSYIKKNGLQAAIEAQMVNGEGQILDQREKIYGRDNPKYLQPLDPQLKVMERTLYGFFRKNGESEYKYGSIQTSDNRLARGWDKVRFYIPCQVPAIVKEESTDDIKLSSSSAEDTLSIFKAINEDIDVQKVIDETLEKQWTPINQVEDFHEKFKDAWDRRLFTKGVVAWLGIDRPTPYGSIKMGLMNPDNEDEIVIVEVPEHLSLDFGELSEVYVFGTTKRSKYYDEDKKLVDGDVNVIASGIFPVVATPKEGTDSTEPKDDTPITGWVD